jgi:pimeloyl-ACP methyl ester carboxylesterase
MLNHRRIGRGEPLVLIHGIGSRWQMWEPVIPLLAGERELFAIDLPGFASSPAPPPGTPAGVASLARLVAGFFDEVGLERPHVAGNSLGGWVAYELAKMGRVRSATGVSPAGFHSPAEARFQRISLRATVRAARLAAPFAHRVMASAIGRQLAFAQLAARPARMSPQEGADNLRDLASAAWFDDTLRAIVSDHFTGGEEIDVPVTVAWGERDRLLLPRQAPRAAAAIPGARSVVLRGCGHVPTWDDPEQVARVLLEGSA